MGHETFARIVGMASLGLCLSLLVSSSIFLASTRNRDSSACPLYIIRINFQQHGKSPETSKYQSDDRDSRQYGYHEYAHHAHQSSEEITFKPVENGRRTTSRWSRFTTATATFPTPEFGGNGGRNNDRNHGNNNSSAAISRGVSRLDMFKGCAIAGIIVAILQTLASFFGFCANKKTARRLSILWMFANMILMIGLIIIFALSLYYYLNRRFICRKSDGSRRTSTYFYEEWLAFTIILALDICISLFLILWSYCTLKSKRYEYESHHGVEETTKKKKVETTETQEILQPRPF